MKKSITISFQIPLGDAILFKKNLEELILQAKEPSGQKNAKAGGKATKKSGSVSKKSGKK